MNIKKNHLYYVIVLGAYLVFKVLYTKAAITNLIFLLKPTNKILEMVLNSKAQFLIDKGYYYDHLNIVINKSCSGFNFWMLCFMMLTFLTLKSVQKHSYKIMSIPLIFLLTYLLTLFVNTSRILFSIVFQKIQINYVGVEYDWLHQAEGIFIYLSFLILIYLGAEHLLKKQTLYIK